MCGLTADTVTLYIYVRLFSLMTTFVCWNLDIDIWQFSCSCCVKPTDSSSRGCRSAAQVHVKSNSWVWTVELLSVWYKLHLHLMPVWGMVHFVPGVNDMLCETDLPWTTWLHHQILICYVISFWPPDLLPTQSTELWHRHASTNPNIISCSKTLSESVSPWIIKHSINQQRNSRRLQFLQSATCSKRHVHGLHNNSSDLTH